MLHAPFRQADLDVSCGKVSKAVSEDGSPTIHHSVQ